MDDKRKALGRGLAALIPQPAIPEASREAFLCPVDQLKPNRRQPREAFDGKRLDELASSIKEKGVLQPIIVRKLDKGFEIVAGERRWRAAVKAGLPRVPVIVRDISDAGSLEIALIENLQRQDLNPMEEALAYRHLMEDFTLTQEDISRRVGKDRSTVANSLRLLRLPSSVQEALRSGEISPGHARALLSLPTPTLQEKALKDIVRKGLSVRQIEAMVQHVQGPGMKDARGKKKRIDPDIFHLMEELKKILGTQVKIHDRGGKGRLEIEYYSWEELERIVEQIRG